MYISNYHVVSFKFTLLSVNFISIKLGGKLTKGRDPKGRASKIPTEASVALCMELGSITFLALMYDDTQKVLPTKDSLMSFIPGFLFGDYVGMINCSHH